MTQVHALYNPTFSGIVRAISSFLPPTVPNLEHDYYIEKVALFTAIPISTYLILLHPFDCVNLVCLCFSETELSDDSIMWILSLYCQLI